MGWWMDGQMYMYRAVNKIQSNLFLNSNQRHKIFVTYDVTV